MKVGFIITANNKEEFREMCLDSIGSYRIIKPATVLCYNGNDASFPCEIRAENLGHQAGDCDLTLRGYERLASLGFFRIIKVGIDTLLLKEQKLLEIFNRMEHVRACYGGNRWGHEEEESFATDTMFLDTRFGSPFSGLFEKDGPSFEHWLFRRMQRHKLPAMMITERIPVHPHNRMECEALRWTMHHQLENNVANVLRWGYCGLARKK
jgi:hypothetical protein